MIKFKVSAPGKVILFGEHSVVYGKAAVAGSIDMRTTLYFKELPLEEASIRFLMPETKMDKVVSIKQIEDCFFNEHCPQYRTHYDNYQSHVEEFIESIGYKDNPQKLCLQAIIFIIVAVYQSQGIKAIKPFLIHAETELSVGAGLGSSASFAVCIVTCFLHYTDILLNKRLDLSSDCLKKITKYAFDCEKIMHGTPSGIDNTICTNGSLLYFRKDQFSTKFPCQRTMRIMLVDTKVQRSTKILVENVKDVKTRYPEVFNPIIEAMDNVAKEGIRCLKSILQSEDGDQSEQFKELAKFMEINHNLLSALGVSHPTLDIICMEAKNYGFTAKLTGAGGGGYAYIVVPHNSSNNKVQNLTDKLIGHGFDVRLTTIGGPGVKIH